MTTQPPIVEPTAGPYAAALTIPLGGGKTGSADLVALSKGGVVTDILANAVSPDGLGLEAIVLGRVLGHDSKRCNCRVEIGASKPAFLPVPDGDPGLRPGSLAPFQIKTLPRDDKGYTLSGDIGVSGRFVVLTPEDPAIKGGRHWPEGRRPAVAAVLSQVLEESVQRAGPAEQAPGWILRSAAREAEDAAIAAEAQRLLSIWHVIRSRLEAADRAVQAHTVLWPGLHPLERLLIDHPDARTVRCPVRDATAMAAVVQRRLPDVAVVPDDGVSDILDVVATLLEPEIALPSGATITIEQTAACVAVDVDQGSCPDRGRANIEAAMTVARHLRLRNLAGTIVIDFLTDRLGRSLVGIRKRLEAELAGDPCRINAIDGPSSLGLIQFARQRRGPPLSSVLSLDDL